MRLITLKTYPTVKGFTLHATIDQIPADKTKDVIADVQISLNNIIEHHSKF